MLPKFLKVFPHEYKRVLGSKAASRAGSHAASATVGRCCARNEQVQHG